MSWKPEVFTEGKWYDNALRFATQEEAEKSARDLFNRWLVPSDWRASECDDPVTHVIDVHNVMRPLAMTVITADGVTKGALIDDGHGDVVVTDGGE